MTILSEQAVLMCKDCGINPRAKHGLSKYGYQRYRTVCNECHIYKTKPHLSYRKHKKIMCERCGFIAEHKCQLDVDHIDGNRQNNNLINLKTLCANCHRLKTMTNKEYTKRKGLV